MSKGFNDWVEEKNGSIYIAVAKYARVQLQHGKGETKRSLLDDELAIKDNFIDFAFWLFNNGEDLDLYEVFGGSESVKELVHQFNVDPDNRGALLISFELKSFLKWINEMLAIGGKGRSSLLRLTGSKGFFEELKEVILSQNPDFKDPGEPEES